MSKVTVGLGTLLGLGLTTAGSAATAWATAEGATAHISPGLLAVLTVFAGSATMLGRMYQAKPAATVVEPATVLTDRPESAVTPEAPPDTAV